MIFEWKDYNPNGISKLRDRWLIIFREVLPTNSRKSFDYHFKQYLDTYYSKDKKETIVEEEERFKNYLMFKYSINDT